METRRVYLDHNATTPLHPEVERVIMENLGTFGNPSSMHSFGRPARKLVEEARERTAGLIGASAGELIFVGSGSEANNTVLSITGCQRTECHCVSDARRQGIVTTRIEHPCVLESAKCMGQQGVPVAFLDVDRTGRIDLGQVAELVTGETRLVSVMLANNEIGTIQDIASVARLAHERGALMHTDAVQAVGKIPVDVKALDVDFLTISAHKLYGPKGVGALYVREGVPFCPMIRGGHQERGRRAGTENTLGIVAMGKAVEMRMLEMAAEEPRLLDLKALLRAGLVERIPDIHFNGHPTESLPNTLNVSFEGAEGEAIMLYLDLAGIAVSTGSACASGSLDPSHVLLAAQLTPEQAHGSVRISMGRGTTREDIDYFIAQAPPIIERIRAMSTAYGRRV
ncbi:aminotransferase class V-fold PLP-dependent enzyme [bacterium]|nr:aminotransferase class V-fold PLP-dependent enzyme [candidate division CSSED10-310 bacterium]